LGEYPLRIETSNDNNRTEGLFAPDGCLHNTVSFFAGCKLISEKQLLNVERLVNGALDGGNAVSVIGAKRMDSQASSSVSKPATTITGPKASSRQMDVFTILFLSLLEWNVSSTAL
jgi:hypothetical protein